MAHICWIYFMHNDMTSLFSVKNTLKGERTSWFGSTSVVVNISNSYQMEEDKYNAGGWSDVGTNVLWVVGINKRIFPVIYLQTHHWSLVSPPRLSDR